MEKLKSEDCPSEDKDADSLEDWEMESPEAVKSSDSKDKPIDLNSNFTEKVSNKWPKFVTVSMRFRCMEDRPIRAFTDECRVPVGSTIGQVLQSSVYHIPARCRIKYADFCDYPILQAVKLRTDEPIDYDTVVEDGCEYYVAVNKRKMFIYLHINDEPLTSMMVGYDASLLEVLELQELNKKSRCYIKDELYGFVFIDKALQCTENETYMIREPLIASGTLKFLSQPEVQVAIEYWPLFVILILLCFLLLIYGFEYERSESIRAVQQTCDLLRQQLNDTKGI
ncbi:hypothetical protein M3Y95_00772400 [Aphelenchoides besseyi]|nr:hypothetical protein M3Y95_00772400 [Aphelenchoides besseyi]